MYVEGRILSVDGTPIPNAAIETWETDANGEHDFVLNLLDHWSKPNGSQGSTTLSTRDVSGRIAEVACTRTRTDTSDTVQWCPSHIRSPET